MRAFLQARAPEVFQNPKFKCCDRLVRRFMASHMGWSWRAGTQASQKLPDLWERNCTDMAMRLTWLINHFHIPESLVLNADQTGIVYIATGSKTWHEKGSKQVPIIGNDEKRQFTLMPTISASGKVLPSQVIFNGDSDRSLPSVAARKATEAKGFIYTSGGKRHWSNQHCMKEVHFQTLC